MMLSKREILVLTAVVELYVDTAQPVASGAICTNLDLSPASVRGTMALLMDKGFLQQPHTSAGRVPSIQGFRYYLDQVLRISPLPLRERSRLQEYILPGATELPQVLRRAAQALSSLTRQVCVVRAPQQSLARWRQIDFVLLRPGMVMAVLVLQGGIICNRLIQIDAALGTDELVYYGNFLNSLFEGRTTQDVRIEILQRLQGARATLDAYGQAWELAAQAVAEDEEPQIFVGGTSYLVHHPEFTALETIQELLRLVEEHSRLLELLDKIAASTSVSVSLEHTVGGSGCSVVTAAYSGHASSQGALALLGPVRMNYARILPLVDFAGQILSQCLGSRF